MLNPAGAPFVQLPPTHNSHGPQPIFCFQSKSWTEVVRECFVLTEIRRQKDPEFIQLLSDVRHGTVSATSRELLASARHTVLDTSDGVQPTRLYSRNDQANAVNDRELGLLSGKSVVYRSVDYSKAKVRPSSVACRAIEMCPCDLRARSDNRHPLAGLQSNAFALSDV